MLLLCCVSVVFDFGWSHLPHGLQLSTAPSRGRKRAELSLKYSCLPPPPLTPALPPVSPCPLLLANPPPRPCPSLFSSGIGADMSHDLKSPPSPISVKVFQTPPPHGATLTSSVISLSLPLSLCPVDVHCSSRPLPHDVWCSGPVRGRSRWWSSQWGRSMIDSWPDLTILDLASGGDCRLYYLLL